MYKEVRVCHSGKQVLKDAIIHSTEDITYEDSGEGEWVTIWAFLQNFEILKMFEFNIYSTFFNIKLQILFVILDIYF